MREIQHYKMCEEQHLQNPDSNHLLNVLFVLLFDLPSLTND